MPSRVESDVDLAGAVNAARAESSPDRIPMVDDADADVDVEADQPDEPIGPVAPLTGRSLSAAEADEVLGRPALVVKIDNHPRARPQTGLDLADIVFDLRAEGVTRFAAVFQSHIPDPVGPVRSSRTSDFDLVRGLDTPIYASSGGNDYVTAGLRELPIIELTNRTRNEYYRDFARPAPHNLFVMGSDLYALAPDATTPPDPWFTYRQPGDRPPAGAVDAIGPVTVSFSESPVVTHTWDAEVGGWLRTQDGRPHLTSDGAQLAPENVVITITDYVTSPADAASPEVVSVGGGPAAVLTDGKIIVGTWSRATAEDPMSLADVDGEPIALTPGRTWVIMPEAGQVGFAPGQGLSGL